MASIASDIQRILDLAEQYSSDSHKQAMRHWAETGRDLERRLASALDEITGPVGLVGLDLRVHAGGQEGRVSPFPWVRVYSDIHAHSAQNGIYLVYLFAADGSRVYLSLHQGTSVPKPGGGMRTTSDMWGLCFRAAQARSALGDHIEAEGAAKTMMSIDLAWRVLQSPDSRRKGRAYEAANILAREYLSGQIPADEQLLCDLVNMLPLLAELYGVTSMAKQAPGLSGLAGQAVAAMTSKRLLDPETRKKIEVWAEDRAIGYFTELGWDDVERVGSEKRGYDLEFRNKAGQILHVEVKGTQTRGEKVVLTGGEVKHNRQAECGADHALFVVSDIRVSREGDIECSNGEATCIQTWSIDEDDLIPTEYDYTVPKTQSSARLRMGSTRTETGS